MNITEWFARAVAAGLMPEWEDIIASTGVNKTNRIWRLEDPNYNISTWIPYNLQWGVPGEKIVLRRKGKDLYSLEWRKPTEQDVGKMCWFYDSDENYITLAILAICDFQRRQYDEDYFFLLADHGQIAPTEADFIKEYGV